MKKSFITLVTLSVVFLASCGDKSKSEDKSTTEVENVETSEKKADASIVGKWKMSDVDLGIEIPEEQQAMFEELKNAMISNSSQEYTDDGNVTIVNVVGNDVLTSTGTYTVDGDKLTMVVEGRTDVVTIKSLTDSGLVLEVEDNGSKMTMTFKR